MREEEEAGGTRVVHWSSVDEEAARMCGGGSRNFVVANGRALEVVDTVSVSCQWCWY